MLDSDGTAHTLSNLGGISYRREPGPDAKPSHVDGVTKNVREIHLEDWSVGGADATVVLSDESYGYGPTVITAARVVSITQVGVKPRNAHRQPKIGTAFVYPVIDDHSRVAYAEIHKDETAATAVGTVLAGHAKVAGRLAIDAPVLTLLSARSTILPRWTPEMMRSCHFQNSAAQRASKFRGCAGEY